MQIRATIGCLLLGALSACSKNTNFNYISPPPPHIQSQFKVKELVGNSLLDMLWVIDNSGSMSIHQQDVIANTDRFADTLAASSTLRWKEGLISTSLSEKPYIGFQLGDELTYSTPQAADVFKSAVRRLGTNGDAEEKMYSPILQALQKYPNFLRTDSVLALIVISDAPEQSGLPTPAFLASLAKYRDPAKVLFYGILNPVEWCEPTDDTWTWAGSPFEALAHAVHSSVFPLCDPDFGSNLIKIGTDLVKQVTSPSMKLAQRPRPETIHVFYDSREIPGGPHEDGGFWQYDFNRNAIIFFDLSFAPDENAAVDVTYDVDDGVR